MWSGILIRGKSYSAPMHACVTGSLNVKYFKRIQTAHSKYTGSGSTCLKYITLTADHVPNICSNMLLSVRIAMAARG